MYWSRTIRRRCMQRALPVPAGFRTPIGGQPMKIFLTGGSGFVGDALLRRLVADGHEVTALARSETSAQRVRTAGAQAVRGDLAELSTVGGAPWVSQLADVDAVVHTAAHMEFWG